MSRRVRVKPGKAQSVSGFFAGLVFVLIGLFVVVPTFGPFGLLWTLFAIIMTATNGVNAFSKKGIATHEITIEDNVSQEISYSQKTAQERLNELQALYDKGMITYEEYQSKRKQILEDI